MNTTVKEKYCDQFQNMASKRTRRFKKKERKRKFFSHNCKNI